MHLRNGKRDTIYSHLLELLNLEVLNGREAVIVQRAAEEKPEDNTIFTFPIGTIAVFAYAGLLMRKGQDVHKSSR